jgi:hypothetical protein
MAGKDSRATCNGTTTAEAVNPSAEDSLEETGSSETVGRGVGEEEGRAEQAARRVISKQ